MTELVFSKRCRYLDGRFAGLDKDWDFSVLIVNKFRPFGIELTNRQPGDFNILTTCFIVSAITFAGVMSIFRGGEQIVQVERFGKQTLVTHTTIGTLNASAIDKCSFDIPMRPAFAPTIRITQEGAPEVKPYNVVLRYFSWPARSIFSF